jgi:hypothetical protein
MNPTLLNTASLPEFFRDQVCQALKSVQVSVSTDTEFYLVNLLTTFTKSEKLFERDEKGEVVDRALALQLFDALVATPSGRIPILKKMGDVALYTSGFFSNSLLGKMVGMDYYINMGSTAYSSLSGQFTSEANQNLRQLFGELSDNFPRLVDVISEISIVNSNANDVNLLKLYERWLATGSQRAQELLEKAGIMPSDNVKTGYTQ